MRLFDAFKREEGQTMAEYGVVLAVITIAVFGALALLSGNIVNAVTQGRRLHHLGPKRLGLKGGLLRTNEPTQLLQLSGINRRRDFSMKRISLRNQDGQSMAEFALVLPILAFLLFAVIQFGIAFNNYITLTDATRAGARKASASTTRRDPNPKSHVRGSCAQFRERPKDPRPLLPIANPTWEPGSDVVVKATYPYSISLFGLFTKSGSLTSTTTERIE